jgi:hypothetical protein
VRWWGVDRCRGPPSIVGVPSWGGSGVGVRYIRSWRAESQSPVSDESKSSGGEGSMYAIDHATGRMVKTV